MADYYQTARLGTDQPSGSNVAGGWLDAALAQAKLDHPDQAGLIDQWAAQTQPTINGVPALSGARPAVQPNTAVRTFTGDGSTNYPMIGGGIAGGTQNDPALAPASQVQPDSGGAYGGKTGAALANDPQYIRDQITSGFQQRYGRNPTDQELSQWMGYATNPDTYSDGTVHQGWNPYLMDRLVTPGHEGASDPRLAGTDTIIGRSVGGGAPSGGGAMGGGGGYGSGTLGSFGQSFQGTPAFQAPTAEEVMNSPAVQARLKLGQEGIQRSAAAKGTLLTGGTLKDLDSFAQDVASQEYGNEYARRFGANQDAFNRAVTGYGLNRDTVWGDQDRQYNRLAGFTQLGQAGAGQLGGYSSGYGAAQGANNAGYAANTGAAGTGYAAGTGQYATNQAGLISGQGNANAGATIAGTNATNSAGSTIANALGTYFSKPKTKQGQDVAV